MCVVGVHREKKLNDKDDYYWLDIATFSMDGGSPYSSQEGVVCQSNSRQDMYGTFVSPTEQSPAIIGDMQPGQQIGLWICRSLDLDAAMEEYNDVAEPDPTFTLGKRYKKKVQNTEDNVNLNIFWD